MEWIQATERLRGRGPVTLFVGKIWDPALAESLRSCDVEALLGGRVVDPHLAAACLAGLHLWNDDFGGSHGICQGIETATGSYWHGLCHRREGHLGEGLPANLGNARYWFRRVGSHPVFPQVRLAVLEVLRGSGAGFRWATEAAGQIESSPTWNPMAMIDWTDQAESGAISDQSADLLARMLTREIEVLLEWCRAGAVGSEGNSSR